jgi:hypothetical protein
MFTERSNRSIACNDLSIGKHKKSINTKRSRSLSKKNIKKSINKSKSSKAIEDRPKFVNKRVNSTSNFSPKSKYKAIKKNKGSKINGKWCKGYDQSEIIYSSSSVISKKSFNPYKSMTGSVSNLEAPTTGNTVRGTPASTKSLMNHKIDFNYSKNMIKTKNHKSKNIMSFQDGLIVQIRVFTHI